MHKFQKYYYNKILNEADRKGGTVRYIEITDLYIKELPSFFKDLTVETYMDVDKNKLTSCKNFPKILLDVYAGDNQIENLDDLQNVPPRSVYFQNNKISSVESLSRFGKMDVDHISLNNNKLLSFKGLENMKIDNLKINNNEISSWQYISAVLVISMARNKLTTWEGMPSRIRTLGVSYNWDVKNMNGFKTVSSGLYMSSSTLTQEDVRRELNSKLISPPLFVDVQKHE